MAVVLPAFWSMMHLRTWLAVPVDAVVFAVMLALALPRGLARLRPGELPTALTALGAGTAAAVGCGMLLDHADWRRALGAAAFTAGVAIPVWARRFGTRWRSAGTMAALPFMAILVHPLPLASTWDFLAWMLLATAVATAWATTPRAGEGRGAAGGATAGGWRRAASTRMAVQLGAATLAGFAVAQWLDPDHLVWPVLTVLVVHSGNRNRGDVLWKGTQRVLGALAGTVLATVATGWAGPGDSRGIVAVFAVLAVASALRDLGHAFWAAGLTAALAFLYGYFGQTGTDLLLHRLGGILAGGAIGVLAAWAILPVRTSDTVRARIGRLRAAAAELAATSSHSMPSARATSAAANTRPAAPHDAPAAAARARLRDAERELALLEPTVRAGARLGFGSARRLADAISEARMIHCGQLG
ncbi:hypothetical protein BKM31_08390 [[Actinomadura] parvosata subsp. kistnae]|uniref:Integral membrane bound transporter domain-containing protein n=1 Tax=[Actinomadura] parvosata subsp. kistnae TaxID=1909395 RepID=A0A1U9ZU56_9ACTN|nr:FUSC family protein [Nonomuraea sp. ATCC 55076]AQZ61490.1 hypothetical protein BKM31_08390 [Nonomuraea sp. ATCC 55076]